MITPEEKAKKWLKHVNSWLNQFEESSLSDPANLLLQRLEREYDRKELKRARDVIDHLDRLSGKSGGSEAAEIHLRCGLIVAEMGNFKDAQDLFSDAASKYVNLKHQCAVAQWMKGCMEWLLSGKEVDAINSWREAEKAFVGLNKSSVNDKDKSMHPWYEAKCKVMHTALHQAAENYMIPLFPSDLDKDENAANGTGAQNNEGNVRSDRMGIFSVYESINAGNFGPSGNSDSEVGKLEIEQVFINDLPYRVLAINGSRFFQASAQDSIVIKVSGDSMNLANICDGEYVLLRLLPKNIRDFTDADYQTDGYLFQGFKDGDIVAAEIANDEGDTSTLKRVFRRGRKIILQPQSTNPKYTEHEFDATDKDFFIRGVVQAILKPV